MSAVLSKIREKLSRGELPRQADAQRWFGRATGKICDACDFPITEIEAELDALDGRVFRFHRECLRFWEIERLQVA
jgi:hypothetical protein